MLAADITTRHNRYLHQCDGMKVCFIDGDQTRSSNEVSVRKKI